MFVFLLTVDSKDTQHNGIQIQYNSNNVIVSNAYFINVFNFLVHVSRQKCFHGKIKEQQKSRSI